LAAHFGRVLKAMANPFLTTLFKCNSCMDDLFQPCTLCSERVHGLSRLERTLFEQNSESSFENSPEALNTCTLPASATSFDRNSMNLYATA